MSRAESQPEPRRPRPRWFHYGLWTLLVVVLLFSIGMSWFAVKLEQARRQRQAVEAIRQLGGDVHENPGPAWLRNLFGSDQFAKVDSVILTGLRDVTDQRLEHLRWLDQIRELDLTCTCVTDSGLEHLNGLTRLEKLYLGGNQVTDAGLAHLTGLARLEELVLNGTQVGDAGLARLSGLGRLRVLRLDSTHVTDAGLEHLQGLSQLQELSLILTQITGSEFKYLTGMSHLQSLRLDGTKVTDAGLGHLRGVTQLEMVEIRYTRATAEGVDKLQDALANCEIRWEPPTKEERRSPAAPDQLR